MKNIKTNIVFNYIKTLMSLLIPMLSFAYISRVLGVQAVGQINYSHSIIEYFVLLASLGIGTYGVREGARIRDNREKLSQLAQELLIINIVSTVFAYALLFILLLNVDKLHAYRKLCAIYSITIGFKSMGMEWLYSAEEEYKYITLRTVIFQILSLLAILLFVRDTQDIWVYVLISMLTTNGSYIINFICCHKYIDLKKWAKYQFKRHFRPILILFAANVSITLYNILDSTMLGYMIGDKAVGIYTAATKVNRAAISFITCLGAVLVPRLSYYYEKGDLKQFEILIKKTCRFLWELSVPVCFLILVLGRPLVYILSGREFENSILTSKLVAPIILFIPFTVLMNNQVFVPMKKDNYMLISTSIGAVVNFFANLVLIPRFEENGAAIATVLAECVVMCVCYFNANRLFNMKKMLYGIGLYFLAALPILPIGFLLEVVISNVYVYMVITVVCSMSVYVAILAWMKDENVKMIYQLAVNIVKRVLRR